ncbi:MAG: alpha-E domain-containing protein [Planctomycetaceae bacterium]|nr:MAG: alpha-E domain-containing protein [Planctomycetaceae bacterium]
MLSRVAESIFWMARYIERAENTARFVEVTLNLVLDQPMGVDQPWRPLINATGDDAAFDKSYRVADAESVTRFLAFDKTYPNSVIRTLRSARENARSVRESLSSEAFEQINTLYHFVDAAARAGSQPDSATEFFDVIRHHCHLLTGILDATMSHDQAWQFANMGRLLERADKTSRILDVKYFTLLPSVDSVGTALDDLQWSSLLFSISGFEAYRRHHHMIRSESVVDFFLLHPEFPRSVLFCIENIQSSLAAIRGKSTDRRHKKPASQVTAVLKRLHTTTAKDILAFGLHQFVDSLQGDMNRIGDRISETYFR